VVSVRQRGRTIFSTEIARREQTARDTWYPGPRGAGTYTVAIVERGGQPSTTGAPSAGGQPTAQPLPAQDVLMGTFTLAVRAPSSPTVRPIRNGRPDDIRRVERAVPRGARLTFHIHSDGSAQTAIGRFPPGTVLPRNPEDSVPIALNAADIVSRRPGSWAVLSQGPIGSLLFVGIVDSTDRVAFYYALRVTA
jgi:hypothetical protein